MLAHAPRTRMSGIMPCVGRPHDEMPLVAELAGGSFAASTTPKNQPLTSGNVRSGAVCAIRFPWWSLTVPTGTRACGAGRRGCSHPRRGRVERAGADTLD